MKKLTKKEKERVRDVTTTLIHGSLFAPGDLVLATSEEETAQSVVMSIEPNGFINVAPFGGKPLELEAAAQIAKEGESGRWGRWIVHPAKLKLISKRSRNA